MKKTVPTAYEKTYQSECVDLVREVSRPDLSKVFGAYLRYNELPPASEIRNITKLILASAFARFIASVSILSL